MKKLRSLVDHVAHLLRMRQLDDVIVGWLAGKISTGLDHFAKKPISWSLRMVGVSLFVVGGIFSLVEPKVSYWDGVWWAFVSMTTVGYGDIAPKTPEVRFMALFVIATGIIATALLVSALTGRVVKRHLRPVNETPELNDDLDELILQLEEVWLPNLRLVQERLNARETNGK